MALEVFSRDIVPILGLVTILLVAYQLRRTNRWNQINFTYALLNSNRLYALEFKVIERFRENYVDIVKCNELSDDIFEIVKGDQSLNRAIFEYLSFINNFCIGIKYNAVESKIAYDAVSDDFIRQRKRYKKYIDWYREDDADVYSELEYQARKWEKQSEKQR